MVSAQIARGICNLFANLFFSFFYAGYVLFCVPKENQKSTASFEARGTNQGLLALDNPKEEGPAKKSGGAPVGADAFPIFRQGRFEFLLNL